MLLGKDKQSLSLPKPICSQDKSASWLYLPFTDREREKWGGTFESYSLKSDSHHLVQCKAAASVCKKERGRRESTGSARLDQGPLQVPLQPAPPPDSTHRVAAIRPYLLQCYRVPVADMKKLKCIWMRGDHLVQITFRWKKKTAPLSSTCAFLIPATEP